MSDRTDPFAELERLLDRLNDAAGRGFEGPLAPAPTPPVDLVDAGEAFEVRVDLPGVAREDVDLRLAGETLHLSADADEGSEAVTYLKQERRRRDLDRAVELPEPVEEEAVTASLSNGVLTVTLPKVSPDEETLEIDIE
jgi:HSP20 family protein